MRTLRNSATYLATGYVLFFGSERLFWSAVRTGQSADDLILTWLAYSVLACVFLNVVWRLEAKSTAAVFLAGALYGWLAEGTLVGTLYGTETSAPFPLSVIWTGVSWHALISVLTCWHFIPIALRARTPWPTVGWSVALGVFWGVWATFLWRETPPEIVSVGSFAAHAFTCTGLLVACYAILPSQPKPAVRPGWPGLAVAALLLAAGFLLQVRGLGVRPLLILPPLTLTALGLLFLARPEAAPNEPEPEATRPALANYAALLAMPVVAVSTYWFQTGRSVPAVDPAVIFWGGGVLSVAVLAWAVFRLAAAAAGRRL